jgi:hypothetical protein
MANTNGSVVFSGENPGLTLYKPGTDEIVVAASFWRSVYSGAGDGNALLIWVSPDAAIGSVSGTRIYADNAGMARIVAERFTGNFENFRDRGFASAEPMQSRFFQEGDGRWYHRVVANNGDDVIELSWWSVLQHELVQRADFELGSSRYDLATVICACEHAAISINNQPVTGDVRVTRTDDDVKSSAFLAFSETWLERG